MKNNKIKLVILNENIFGYINPEDLNTVQHIHASILKGAQTGLDGTSSHIKKSDKIRPVKRKDFEEFNIYFPQYIDDCYQWDKPPIKKISFSSFETLLHSGHVVPRDSNNDIIPFNVGQEYIIKNKENESFLVARCTQNCPYHLIIIK